MSRRIRMFLCALVLCICAAGAVLIPECLAEEPVRRDAPVPEAEYTVAWWSMMYEMPNPERLPVRVRFQWLKGLE